MNPQERRTTVRKVFRHLAYLSLPSDNGGIVLDASEGGLRFHSIGPIQSSGSIEFRFAIDSATRITATGEIAWKDSTGRTGGLRFTQLTEEARQQLRLWINQSNIPATPRPAIESVLDIIDLPGTEKKGAGNSTRSPIALQAGELGLLAASTVTSAALAMIERLEASVPAAIAAAAPPVATAPVATPAPAAADQPPAAIVAVSANDLDESVTVEDVAVSVAPIPVPPPESAVPTVTVAIAAETFPTPRTQMPPYNSNAVAARAREAISASKSKRTSSPIVASALPPRVQSSVPTFGAQANQFSMFGQSRKPAGKSSASFAQPSVPIQNPVGAVILTIALAFIVSVGVFTCLFQTRAGDAVVHWGQALWGISNPQEISEVPSGPAAAPDASSSSQSR